MRRAARSIAVAAVVAAIVLANVPGSRIDGLAQAVGLGQAWGVFAPDPIRTIVELEAEIRYADGSSELWRPPGPRAVLQERGYRWQQWARELAADEHSELWEPAGRWLARTHARPRRRPVSVTLRRRFAALPPPGAADAPLRWNEFDFFTLDLR